jgi:hypothetical protein
MKSSALELEQQVTITATKGPIVIEAAHRQDYKLEDLLPGMTDRCAFSRSGHVTRLGNSQSQPQRRGIG